MMKKTGILVFITGVTLAVVISQIMCTRSQANKTETRKAMIIRGEYLVNLGGCNDCHSPKVMSPMGPIPDPNRLLSGHPASEPVHEANIATVTSGNWILAGKDFTSYVGPWGISFASNLTPDSTTGIGAWDEATFIKSLREGKYMGNGRPLLPPMPWQAISKLSDRDLKDIFAYLKSIKPIENHVPQPISPNEVASVLSKK